MNEFTVELLKKSIEDNVRALQVKKYKIYQSLYEIHPHVLSILGGVEFRISNIEDILSYKEWEKNLFDEEQEIIRQFEEESIIEEKNRLLLEEYYKEIDCDSEYEQEIVKKQDLRKKVNKLRKLRLDDLDKLRNLRNGNFSEGMNHIYDSLKEQYFNYEYEYYIDIKPRPYSDDFKKITNINLIKAFKITLEEQSYLKSIISKDEIKRRKNLKRRNDRRNEYGRTKRQEEKYQMECKIKKIISENPNINKSEVAKKVGLNKSTISRTYRHLF